MKEMSAEPTARPARSMVVRGICPLYFGGGRLSTENVLEPSMIAHAVLSSRGILCRERGGRKMRDIAMALIVLCWTGIEPPSNSSRWQAASFRGRF